MLPEIILGHILGFKAEEDGDIKKKNNNNCFTYIENFSFILFFCPYMFGPKTRKLYIQNLKGPL